MADKSIEKLKHRCEKLRAEKRTLRETIVDLKREHRNTVKTLREGWRLLEALPGGVVLIQDGKIAFMNKTARDALGSDEDEVQGHDFTEFFQPDVGAELQSRHRKRLSGRPVSNRYETRLVTRTGKVLWCEIRVKKILMGGRRAFLLNLIGLDERKEGEKRRAAAEKSEAITRMSRGLYHEIGGWFRISKKDRSNHPEEDRSIGSGKSADGAETPKKLEKGWSLLRELEWLGGMHTEEREASPYDLRKVVQDVVASAKNRWCTAGSDQENGIRIKSYLRALPTLEGRPEEMKYALTALVQNAVEALGGEGNIYLTTEESEGAAHLYIQDSGAGIPSEIEDRVCDPFFTTREKDRRGLGLSLARAIIRRNGGYLDLKSAGGGGTTCTVRLPIPAQASHGQRKKARVKMKDVPVLVVSTQDILRDLLSRWFSSRGCRVDATSTCGEAFQWVQRKEYGLLVVDTEDTDCRNLTGLLRKAEKLLLKTPVVLIQNPLRPGSANAGKHASGRLVLEKPLHMDRVHSVFLEALRERGPD